MVDTVLDRFLRYVKIDTQSKFGEDCYPSTPKQFDLLNMLKEELLELGLTDVDLDEKGYLMATIPSNLPEEQAANVPVIGFLAHVDTSPDFSGTDVRPMIHANYQGGDLRLSEESGRVILADENLELKKFCGADIVTSDGTTLLGADDKAGVAAIMTLAERLVANGSIPHGKIRFGFTPDEEVGKGTTYFDVEKFGADFAYTVDGDTMGLIEDENFNAATVRMTFHGRTVHPGYARDKMVNSIRAAADAIALMPRDMAPETSSGYEGYVHPHRLTGRVEESKLSILLRDFTDEGMKAQKQLVRDIASKVEETNPGVKVQVEVEDSYNNMKSVLDKDPRVVEYAMEAVKRAGIEPVQKPIRGGTDGARLCYMGLPTPNIFTGGQNFHGPREWIAVPALEGCVNTLVELVKLWVERTN